MDATVPVAIQYVIYFVGWLAAIAALKAIAKVIIWAALAPIWVPLVVISACLGIPIDWPE